MLLLSCAKLLPLLGQPFMLRRCSACQAMLPGAVTRPLMSTAQSKLQASDRLCRLAAAAGLGLHTASALSGHLHTRLSCCSWSCEARMSSAAAWLICRGQSSCSSLRWRRAAASAALPPLLSVMRPQ